MNALVAGVIAVLVGGGLSVVTAIGVVNSVSSTPTQPEDSVMNYGTNQTQ